MSDWHCVRCGQGDAPRMKRPPFPGRLGERVAEEACAHCWGEWDRARIMIVNEYRLNMSDPEDFGVLMDQMKKFFGFKTAEG